ncbi:MAG: DUF5106 domain-containing protein [Chitinophagales bacterium]|nr:DUF5106 domain-containing protein [Chitinophagales bacterium]
MKRFALLLLLALFAGSAQAGNGHEIKVKLTNYEAKTLVLGFYYGDKPYVKDTFDLGPDGYFTFKADTLLPAGVYLLVLQPKNDFIQFAVPANDQQFTLTTDAANTVDKMKVEGSDDNKLFYEYMRYLSAARPEADTLRKQMEQLKSSPKDSVRIAGLLDGLDKKVKKYQGDLVKKYPATITARIVKASIEPEIPEVPGDEKRAFAVKREWLRAHYFDNVDISDPVMLRTPVLHPRIESFVQKFTVQHPDSINASIDQLIKQMEPNQELYKFYLIWFLNHYAKSNIVGMDGVYVHIGESYYCNGKVNWTKKEDQEKICDNVARLKPILIGKIAPNIAVKDFTSGAPSPLWDVDADYTVLFFWDPECGHCKKAAPFMVEFSKKFKDRGVKVFAVCTATGDKAGDCGKSIEEKGFNNGLFINTYDPYLQSRFKQLYDVRVTPQIFILDRKHEILMKRIGAEQLNEVMEQVIKFQEDKKKQSNK